VKEGKDKRGKREVKEREKGVDEAG